jgi:hypothetical protein
MMLRAAFLLALLAASPARAQDRPAVFPTRDVSVAYHVETEAPAAPHDLRVEFAARAGRLRIDGGPQGYMLVDRGARRASMVIVPAQMVMDMPPGGGPARALMLDGSMQFSRRGRDRVAGLACTVWDVRSGRGSGTACITADGVLLRASGQDADGHAGTLTAESVAYGPQSPALFEPPAGFRHVALPALRQ